MRRGRPKKDPIEENIDKIEKLASEGKSNRQIADELGISQSTFYKYKTDKCDEALKNGRKVIVEKLENTMLRSAMGFTRKVKRYEKLKRVEYEDGRKLREYEDLVEIEEEMYFKPDVTAGIFMLKNWANYANEPLAIKLREEELKLQQQKVENAEW